MLNALTHAWHAAQARQAPIAPSPQAPLCMSLGKTARFFSRNGMENRPRCTRSQSLFLSALLAPDAVLSGSGVQQQVDERKA